MNITHSDLTSVRNSEREKLITNWKSTQSRKLHHRRTICREKERDTHTETERDRERQRQRETEREYRYMKTRGVYDRMYGDTLTH